jgi:hypothetical protein
MVKVLFLGIFLSSHFAFGKSLDDMRSMRVLVNRVKEVSSAHPEIWKKLSSELDFQLKKESAIVGTKTYDVIEYNKKAEALRAVFWFLDRSQVYKPRTLLEDNDLNSALKWGALIDLDVVNNLITAKAELAAGIQHQDLGTRSRFEASEERLTGH